MRKYVKILTLVALTLVLARFVLRSDVGTEPVRDVAREPAASTAASARRETATNVVTSTRAKNALSPKQALASRRKPAPEAGAETLSRFEDIPHVDDTRVNDRPYRILAARGVRAEHYSSALGPVLFEENGVRVYEDRADGWDDLRVSTVGQPVLVNPANGRLVYVTGTLKITLASEQQAHALAADEHLEFLEYKSGIKLAFMRAPAGYHLLSAVRRLEARPGVTAVELETVEGRRTLR